MQAASQLVCAVVLPRSMPLSSIHSTQAEKAKAKEAAKAANGAADEPPSGLEHVAGEGQVGAGWFVLCVGFNKRTVNSWGGLVGQQVGGEGAACACLAPQPAPRTHSGVPPGCRLNAGRGGGGGGGHDACTAGAALCHAQPHERRWASAAVHSQCTHGPTPQWLLCSRGAQLAAAPGFACPTSVAALEVSTLCCSPAATCVAAGVLDGLKQYERGQELLTRANDIAVCAWGPGSMQHLNVLYALAQHFRRRNMIQESIDFHEQASAGCVAVGGEQLLARGGSLCCTRHAARSTSCESRVSCAQACLLACSVAIPTHSQPTHSRLPYPFCLPHNNKTAGAGHHGRVDPGLLP